MGKQCIIRLSWLLQNPSPQNGSAQPRPPDAGVTVAFGMGGEPVVSRGWLLKELLYLLFVIIPGAILPP